MNPVTLAAVGILLTAASLPAVAQSKGPSLQERQACRMQANDDTTSPDYKECIAKAEKAAAAREAAAAKAAAAKAAAPKPAAPAAAAAPAPVKAAAATPAKPAAPKVSVKDRQACDMQAGGDTNSPTYLECIAKAASAAAKKK